MALRFNGTAQAFARTANLPAPGTYSVCGWGLMSVDRNAFSTYWTIENTQFEGVGTDTDGTTLQFFNDGGTSNIDTLVADRWFWWGAVRNGTAWAVYYVPQPGSAIQTFSGTLANVGTPSSMTIMNDNSRASSVNGKCAGLKLWDAVLTADEMAREVYTLRPQRFANLNLWTPMIHGTAALAATDFSGNARPWTVVSTPTIEQGPPVSWAGRIIVPSETVAAADQSVTLTGVEATGAVGTLTATADSTATLTGVAATGQVGTLTATAAATVTLTGVQATGQVGDLTATAAADVALTGVGATGAVGTLATAATADVVLTGVQAVGAVGDLALAVSDTTITLSGIEALGGIGTLTAAVPTDDAQPLDGVSARGGRIEYVADRTDRRHAAAQLTGVSASGFIGSLLVSVDAPPPLIDVAPPTIVPAPVRPQVLLRARQDAVAALTGVAAVGATIAAGTLGTPQPVRDTELEEFMLLAAAEWGP